MTRRDDVLAVRAKGDRREKKRGEIEAMEIRAKRLQAARDGVSVASMEMLMYSRLSTAESDAFAKLIKAHIELALLERGS